MYAAITHIVALLKNSSPFAGEDPDSIPLPFHEKIFLFRMVEEAHRKRLSDPEKTPWFTKKPQYKTFIWLLGDPDFAKLKFHRVVRIGRCPKCCLLRWHCLSATSPAQPEAWQRVASAHQTLQLEQKKVYAVDRAKAAQDFPQTELYMGFDGGSGFEFWLPHLSANDMEGPNKAADNVHCPLFKIMNGMK